MTRTAAACSTGAPGSGVDPDLDGTGDRAAATTRAPATAAPRTLRGITSREKPLAASETFQNMRFTFSGKRRGTLLKTIRLLIILE